MLVFERDGRGARRFGEERFVNMRRVQFIVSSNRSLRHKKTTTTTKRAGKKVSSLISAPTLSTSRGAALSRRPFGRGRGSRG